MKDILKKVILVPYTAYKISVGILLFIVTDFTMLIFVLLLIWAYFQNQDRKDYGDTYRTPNSAVERDYYESLDYCDTHMCRGME